MLVSDHRQTIGIFYLNLKRMCEARLIDPSHIDRSISYEENLRCLFNIDSFSMQGYRIGDNPRLEMDVLLNANP